MTSKEHVKLQQFVNRVQWEKDIADETFKELQDLSEAVGSPRWCNAESNFSEVIEHGTKAQQYRAAVAYQRFLQANARRALFNELMGELAELNFWHPFSLDNDARYGEV